MATKALMPLNSFEQALRERTALRRELIDGRADVGLKLPAGICDISNLPYLAQGLRVVIEQRRRNDVTGAHRANSC